MAKFTAQLNLSTNGKGYSFTRNGSYEEVFQKEYIVDNADSFVKMMSITPASISQDSLQDAKFLCIHNPSNQAIELRFITRTWTAGAIDVDSTNTANTSTLLLPNDYIVLPNAYAVDYSATTSSTEGTATDFSLPAVTGKLDSTANVDTATSGDIGSDATETTLYVEPTGENLYFSVGDYLRLENEICKVTALGTGADLGNSTLTITRGELGSTGVVHADGVAVEWYFYNNLGDFDKDAVVQTDRMGRFEATNFFGLGRQKYGTSSEVDSIQRGTVCILFATSGYQDFGLTGIKPSDETGLSASTSYWFDMQVNGGTADTITFTTSSSNTTFAQGSDSVLKKIQDVFNTFFYTSTKNMFQDKVSIFLTENGDVRIQSGNRGTASAISFVAKGTSGSDYTFFATGRIPAGAVGTAGGIQTAVASSYPDTTATAQGITTFNEAEIMYDDGHGNLISQFGASGNIDYSTGAISMRNAPPLAQFKVACNTGGALCGGVHANNVIQSISARSTNQYRNARIQVIGLN